MGRCCSIASFYCLLLSIIALSGCASSPYSTSYPLAPEYLVSPEGDLRYKIPDGWLDASNDAHLHNSILWLVRRDYAATIDVREIVIDEEARKTINAEGLPAVATLIMKMTRDSAIVLVPPEEFSTNNMECCSYESRTSPEGDITRVVIVKAGSKMYEMTALVLAKEVRDQADVFSVQQSLLHAMRW